MWDYVISNGQVEVFESDAGNYSSESDARGAGEAALKMLTEGGGDTPVKN